jgi:hypothetical protein
MEHFDPACSQRELNFAIYQSNVLQDVKQFGGWVMGMIFVIEICYHSFKMCSL